MISKQKLSGFSLLELSIVLVVIGLIVGGTLQGVEILKNAELKSIIAEVEEYKSAMGQFEELYGGLPGDINNATSYWSTTANGDNDGMIDKETSNEPFRALQQLMLADLVQINVNGVWGTGFVVSAGSIVGNVASTKSNRGGVGIYPRCCTASDYITSRSLDFNNVINVFTVATTTTRRSGALTPVEAFSIDEKMDDGIPDTGFVGASGAYNTTDSAYRASPCYSGTGSTSTYDSAVANNKNSPGCQMLFGYDWEI